jgi:cytoskeletal protein CcmA (bactofilin family)
MIWHKRNLILSLVVLFIIISFPASLVASIFFGENNYVLPARDTLDDDLYLGTGEADIIGAVGGDLCIGAKRFTVSGEINGSLNSASQFATLEGKIGNSARVFAQRITVDGEITNNLIACGSDIELGRSSHIGRDVTLAGSDISVSGEVGDELFIRGDQVIISGKIGGDVDIKANSITIVVPAEILGDIKYESKKKIRIDDEAIITGEVDWIKIRPKSDRDDDDEGLSFGIRVVLFLATLVTGLIIIPVFNQHTKAAADRVVQKSVACLGIGFVFLCVAPIAILILMVTVIGIPAAIILLFGYTIVFYISKIYVAIGIGRLACRAFKKNAEPKQGWSLLFGLIILMAIFSIPVFGWFAYFATIFCGIGAIILGLRKSHEAGTPAQPDQPAPSPLPPAPDPV